MSMTLRPAALLLPVFFSFALTACHNGGPAPVQQTTTPPTSPPAHVNVPPHADAGPAQTVNAGSVVMLSGANSTDSDGSIVAYHWQQTAPAGTPVTLSNANSVAPSFTAPAVSADTAFIFQLTVTDNSGASTSASVTITVRPASAGNQPPVANAGADQAVLEGALVVLDGAASHDPDASDTITYAWTQTAPASPVLAISNSTAAQASFTAPQVAADTTFTFALTVSDNHGAHTTDTVNVLVRDSAVAPLPQIGIAAAPDAGEGNVLVFPVTLSADSAQTVTVQYASQDGTATAAQDYTATSGTLTFAPHETSKSIAVQTLQDGTAEPTETLSVLLSAPTNATIFAPAASGNVLDDDAAGPAYGAGVIGALALFMHDANGAFAALVQGDSGQASTQLQTAFSSLSGSLTQLIGGNGASVIALLQAATAGLQDPATLVAQLGAGAGALAGIDTDAISAVTRAVSANRNATAVVLTGVQVPAWAVPAAQGIPYPYPSGATISGALFDALHFLPGQVSDAHNGIMLYPLPGAPSGKPVDRIAAYKWDGARFVEIPVQVDEKFPYFLANAGSDFSVYSGTDEELTYAWDLERWQNTSDLLNLCKAGYSKGMADPVAGLDIDDEIAFMAQDAGAMAPAGAKPDDPELDAAEKVQMVALIDVLAPQTQRYVYLGLKQAGHAPKFAGKKVYVDYQRDANADQWIDHTFFGDGDPFKLGTSNTGYGPNRSGKVCGDGTLATARDSTDRFPRDGVTVSTDAYRWYASGRWMVREMRVAKPNQNLPAGRAPGEGVVYGADLIDRWKGRAFQQAPDSNISIVGFEDEQVNWEANATLLGERCGPVRCMREVWGADSGTNVTKTETFYRDAVSYRYHVRVHPIPPDGLYTSWDYNRSAMVPAAGEHVPGGRYYTVLRPQGVPIDGSNDDIGQIDSITPLPVNGQCVSADASGLVPPNPDGHCPAFFDVADPTFNLPLAFDNWEQVSGKGDLGSLVYTFELKGLTSVANPAVIPFYRDDACLDDGTGDDPVQRPYPGEAQTDARVRAGYVAAAGGDPAHNVDAQFINLRCDQKQGAYAAHGVHYLVTHDSDNAFLLGVPIDEVDGQQWQFAVPTAQPMNIAEPYANNVRVPLTGVAVPLP